jgi:hypothetical protein
MAKASEDESSKGGEESGGGGWIGLLTYLNRTFDLVRDVFGYALPGGVFLGIGVVSGSLSLDRLHSKLSPYDPPTWALAFLVIGACYAVGHILITIAYTPYDLLKLGYVIFRKNTDIFPTEVTKDLVKARRSHPELFPTVDRRETLSVTIAGLFAALLLSAYCFYDAGNGMRTILIGAAGLMFLDFVTAQLHLYRVKKAIKEASHEIKTELQPGEAERAALGLVKYFLKSEAGGVAPVSASGSEDFRHQILKALNELADSLKKGVEAALKSPESSAKG